MTKLFLSLVSVGALAVGCAQNNAKSANESAEHDTARLETVSSYSGPSLEDPTVVGARTLSQAAEVAEEPTLDTAIDYEASGAPAGTDALARALRARHAEDVPKEADIVALENGPAILLYLEANGKMRVEQVRAVQMMRYVKDDAAVTARLQALVADDAVADTVRVAAIRVLASDRDKAQVRSALEAGRASSNARVQEAAERALADE